MAYNLVEAEKYSQDKLILGVIEEIVKDSDILQKLPFIEVVGNGLTYNRETTLGAAGWYSVGDTWTESTPTVTPHYADILILGGDADIDNFLLQTRSNQQDIKAQMVKMKTKAMQHEFEDKFIYGNHTTSVKEIDGLMNLVDSGMRVDAGDNANDAGSMNEMLQLIDFIKGGKPDMLLMNKAMRRRLRGYAAAAGYWSVTKDPDGRLREYLQDVPISVSDFITQTETADGTAKTGAAFTSIWAIQFGEGGLCGLESGKLQVVPVADNLPTKDASRIRIKWYVGLALFCTLKVAQYYGLADYAFTA